MKHKWGPNVGVYEGTWSGVATCKRCGIRRVRWIHNDIGYVSYEMGNKTIKRGRPNMKAPECVPVETP